MTDHCFISYSGADGLDFATRLADELQGQHPFFKVWFDKRELSSSSSDDWDDQLGNAIKACKCLIFVMTEDSTADGSVCKDEWTWALKYKKPVITIRKDQKADVPFRLNNRQHVDFVTSFDVGIAQLRTALARLDLPEGALDELKSRLADANRDLRRAKPEYQLRIKVDIEELKKQIEVQENIVKDPQAAQEQTQKNIETGLERERHPEKPLAPKTSGKFINQPPGIAQTYFRDRELESEQTILFLKNDAQRIMTIAGRGGAGKTAMTCRLLKHIENGTLPDGFEKKHGKIEVDGIIYLSETGSRKINFANLFADLCLLLSNDTATKLTALYKQPQTSTESKTLQLLEAFQGLKQLIVLLDNFENVVDVVSETIKDLELGEALRTILHAPHHPLKIIITTRATAERFNLYEPARQRVLHLDTGLLPEYAKEAFVLMDEDDLVGIKNSGNELLDLAVTRTLGLPRALEALYAALRSDRFTTLKELLDLPVLPENVVEAYVGEAFNRLDTNAQKVMQALAVYNRPVTPAAVDFLLAPHIPAMDSAPILQRLANMHFARKESGRFYLHPVDREFAFGLIPEKDLTTKDTMVTKEKEKVSDVPDVSDVIKVKPDDVIPASETDEESTRKAKQAVEELKALFAEMKAKESNYQLPITIYPTRIDPPCSRLF
ncbi:MAG: toll/interleukin-1 receptor domain-containing protein [Chloroflexota bacterium]